MLAISTKKKIKNKKWKKHSNKYQFISRVKKQSLSAFDDLTFLANELDEEYLQKIFTKENMQKLIVAVLRGNENTTTRKLSDEERERLFALGFMFIGNALNVTGRMIDNKWAQELYIEHEIPLRRVLRGLYNERSKK